jgi:hypothetical protein
MRYLLVLLLIAGCSTTVPVARKFPEAPAKLLEPAPELRPIPPNTTELSVLIDNAADNYTQYRNLRELYDAWQEWYRDQKANFDSVK